MTPEELGRIEAYLVGCAKGLRVQCAATCYGAGLSWWLSQRFAELRESYAKTGAAQGLLNGGVRRWKKRE